MTTDMASADAWLSEITTQARKCQLQVFSVSVPVAAPGTPQEVPDHLVAAAIEGVENQGWKLESVSAYGGASGFWALLVFCTTYV